MNASPRITRHPDWRDATQQKVRRSCSGATTTANCRQNRSILLPPDTATTTAATTITALDSPPDIEQCRAGRPTNGTPIQTTARRQANDQQTTETHWRRRRAWSRRQSCPDRERRELIPLDRDICSVDPVPPFPSALVPTATGVLHLNQGTSTN